MTAMQPSPGPRQPGKQKWVQVNAHMAELAEDELGVRAWDDEELFRGQRRSRKGDFSGAPPKWIPRTVYTELVRRQMERAEQQLVESVAGAVQELARISRDPEVDDSVKLRAIDMILKRVLGDVSQRIEIAVDADKPAFKELIESVTIRRSEDEWEQLDEDDVVDAEVVDDEPSDMEAELDEWED